MALEIWNNSVINFRPTLTFILPKLVYIFLAYSILPSEVFRITGFDEPIVFQVTNRLL